MKRLAALAGAAIVAVAVRGTVAATPVAHAAGALPPVKHVFVIVLENKGYDESFGPSSPARYLRDVLRPQAKLLPNYYATGHLSLDNYISMVSGQPPNPQTQADCPFFTDFVAAPGTESGIAVGQGCVHPAGVKTLADQLEARGLAWKGYMEDMGNDPVRDNGTACAHPTPGPLPGPTTQDHTQSAAANDQYATRHNPWVYFHSIIDRPACAANDVPLTRLPADLTQASTTASFSFITPNLCHDGHDGSGTTTGAKCANGEPGGLLSSDQFLQAWVPRILASPGYQDGGMLVVTWDEAEDSDTTACCGEQSGPNTPPDHAGINGPGGGRVGAVVLSRFVRAGTASGTSYNHYSFLRTMEDLFGLDHLGYAAQLGLQSFGADVFDAPAPTPGAVEQVAPTRRRVADARDPAALPATGSSSNPVPALACVAAGLMVRRLARRRRRS
jgi:hypothetical protein